MPTMTSIRDETPKGDDSASNAVAKTRAKGRGVSAKRAGAEFEVSVLRWLRERGMNAERLAKAGSLDEGDIVFHADEHLSVVLELKVRREKTTQLSLGAWLAEAAEEASHYATARNLAVDP